ncbi:PPE family protein [Saccharothrix carnea]|uniref:PPE family protein n=1 Tax=Saccharothrix carnea TaxID=1280637 RepID=A0A2P8I3D3_SACCR|nr:PPE domain-containing protein [Saccharothrix carnea]PSL52955.1 PPE family protein [Saccharothrix carnea]
MNERERKGGYWSDFHDYSPATRRRNEKRLKQRRENRKPENFGKINWRAYTHRQLWDMVKSADAAQMATRTYEWKRLAEDIDQATSEVRKIVQNLALSWRGPSAVAASESVTRLTRWGADASQRAFQVGGGLDGYTAAVAEAAQAIPEPVHPDAEKWFRQGYDVTALDGPQGSYMLDQLLDDHRPSKEEQREAMDRAVRVMEQYEAAAHSIGRELPVFEQAPVVTNRDAEQWTPGVPLPWHGPTPTPPPVWERPAPTGPVDRPPLEVGTRPEGTTTAASVGGPAVGGPGYPGAGGPGGFGGANPGFGSFGPHAGGTGGGGQGGFGPMGPGGSSGVLGAVPGGAAARGGVGPVVGAGGPQGFGMYPPMAPGNREEDAEHRNRYDLGLDLLDDLPPAFPPVLGE